MLKSIPGLVIALVLLSISLASAQEIGLDVHPSSRTVHPYEKAYFLLTMENGRNVDDDFYLFVTGTPAFWVNVDTSYLVMPAMTNRTLNLFFYPNDMPGVYDYTVFLQSRSSPNLKVGQDIQLTVLGVGGDNVELVDHDIHKGSDSVDIRIKLSSFSEKVVTIDYVIASERGKIVATDTRSYTVRGEKGITHSIPIQPDIVAGEYTIRVKVKGTGIELSSSFDVEPVHRIVKREDDTSTPLYHEMTITVSNEGNVIEEDYAVKSSIPTGYLSFSRQPAECGDDWCEWLVSKLNPEESMQIIYRIEYWPLILEGVVIAALLVSFFIIGWNKATRPKLIKRLEKGEGGGYTTVLEIKNAGKKITNVVIRDEVSPLFEVKGKFETIKPAIKQTEDGTEMVWSLGAIEPKDHRIIHYSIKPVVNGHLKMPRAYMRYVSKGNKRSKVTSKEVYLAA